MMNRLNLYLLLFGALASFVVAASAPTFCKCTCFTNSTIIEIKAKTPVSPSKSKPPPVPAKPPPSDDANPSDGVDPSDSSDDNINDGVESLLMSPLEDGTGLTKRAPSSSSCSQCNKAFCLGQSLPICKTATEKDVVTMCFQRDSRKDQIIVWGFILGTAGLLGWAGVQKVVEMRDKASAIGIGLAGGPQRSPGLARGLDIGGGPSVSSGSDVIRGSYQQLGGHSREGNGAG